MFSLFNILSPGKPDLASLKCSEMFQKHRGGSVFGIGVGLGHIKYDYPDIKTVSEMFSTNIVKQYDPSLL